MTLILFGLKKSRGLDVLYRPWASLQLFAELLHILVCHRPRIFLKLVVRIRRNRIAISGLFELLFLQFADYFLKAPLVIFLLRFNDWYPEFELISAEDLSMTLIYPHSLSCVQPSCFRHLTSILPVCVLLMVYRLWKVDLWEVHSTWLVLPLGA